MMKAAVLHALGEPCEIEERAIPDPQEGQVLIKIHASGLCGTDLHVQHGVLPVSLPVVLGHEPVGEIVSVGPGVLHLNVGDRVGVSWVQRGCGRCEYCQGENPKYCSDSGDMSHTWVGMGGGMAEYMLAWASGVTLLPDALSYELAAPLFCAGFTIASGFHNAAPKPKERVAVYGVGGLGHLAVQYAKAKGHPVIALTSKEDKCVLAKQLGADEAFLVDDKILDRIQAVGGIDILLHTGNASHAITSLLPAMRPEGRVVLMGLDRSSFQAPPLQMITKQLRIIGSMQNRRSDLVDILHVAAKGFVKPMIEIYRLDDLSSVFKRLEDGKVRFRAVISFF